MSIIQAIPPKLLKERKGKGVQILKILKKLFPKATIALKYKTPWELYVAVALSAQCTDVQVNKITPALFKKYPTLEAYVRALPREFERDIHSCGFFRNKTKNILAAAKFVKKEFHGKLPRAMDEMLEIPGVGRKSANVILGNAYGVVQGIAVDTHVKRLAKKLGLSSHGDPNKIERDLMEIFPKKEWFPLTYRLIEYGRNYCVARPHDHAHCPLAKFGI